MAQDTQSVEEVERYKPSQIYKMGLNGRICLPGLYHTGCAATRKLRHTMYGYTLGLLMSVRAH